MQRDDKRDKMQNKKLISIAVILVLLVAGIAFLGYLGQGKKNTGDVSTVLTIDTLGHKRTFDYSGEAISALELLKKYAVVNTSSSKYGEFVNCIDSVCSDDKNYWMYSVNGNLASIGAGDYLVDNKDSVEFSFGK